MKLAVKILFWVIVIFILFAHLDSLPIIIWDESRLAVGAYEMFKYGNPFVVHYDASPDMWSMKPPLMIWFQVCMIKLVGYGTIAIRLPSALAALGTCLLLFAFLKKYTKSALLPYLVVGILVTTPGYIMIHGARTGDYDSLYVFFSTLYVLTFFHFLNSKNNRVLLFVFLGILLAVMTKSVAGLIFAPFLVFYAFYKKAVLNILKSWQFYIGFAFLLSVLVSYYLYREKLAPGSWAVVVYEELGGRLSGKIQDDKQPWSYYFRLMFNEHYYLWFPFAVLGIVRGFYETNKEYAEVFKY